MPQNFPEFRLAAVTRKNAACEQRRSDDRKTEWNVFCTAAEAIYGMGYVNVQRQEGEIEDRERFHPEHVVALPAFQPGRASLVPPPQIVGHRAKLHGLFQHRVIAMPLHEIRPAHECAVL